MGMFFQINEPWVNAISYVNLSGTCEMILMDMYIYESGILIAESHMSDVDVSSVGLLEPNIPSHCITSQIIAPLLLPLIHCIL